MVKLEGMKVWRKVAVVFLFITLSSFSWAFPVQAEDNCTLRTSNPTNGNFFVLPEKIEVSSSNVKAPNSNDGANPTSEYVYFLHIYAENMIGSDRNVPITSSNLRDGILSPMDITSTVQSMFSSPGQVPATIYIQLERETGLVGDTLVCGKTIRVQNPTTYDCGVVSVQPTRTGENINLAITVSGGNLNPSESYAAWIDVPGWLDALKVPMSKSGNTLTNGTSGRYPDGTYYIEIGKNSSLNVIQAYRLLDHTRCGANFTIDKDSLIDVDDPGNTFSEDPPDSVAFTLCQQAANEEDMEACLTCFGEGHGTGSGPGQGDKNPPKKFWTAFGCVETSATGIVQSFLRIGLGLAGGFVLLAILYGAFLLTTSSGDPNRVKEGQEMISSAVMGLLFVIFSVVILQFIGVTILRIPGFGT